MSQSARVTSIEAIKEFRAALCRFGEDVSGALGAVEMEARRTLDWLIHDRPLYWQGEIKRRKEDVALAQAELFRRKIQSAPGREVQDSEQKENLRKAKRRLQEAEERLEVVRRWGPVFEQEFYEYQGRARPTGDMLESDLRAAVALLDRMTEALDAYVAMAPPSTSTREAVGSSAASQVSSGSPSAPSAIQAPAAEPETAAPETAEPEAPDAAGAGAPGDEETSPESAARPE